MSAITSFVSSTFVIREGYLKLPFGFLINLSRFRRSNLQKGRLSPLLERKRTRKEKVIVITMRMCVRETQIEGKIGWCRALVGAGKEPERVGWKAFF